MNLKKQHKSNIQRVKNNNYKISLFPYRKTNERNHQETFQRYLHHIHEQYSNTD